MACDVRWASFLARTNDAVICSATSWRKEEVINDPDTPSNFKCTSNAPVKDLIYKPILLKWLCFFGFTLANRQVCFCCIIRFGGRHVFNWAEIIKIKDSTRTVYTEAKWNNWQHACSQAPKHLISIELYFSKVCQNRRQRIRKIFEQCFFFFYLILKWICVVCRELYLGFWFGGFRLLSSFQALVWTVHCFKPTQSQNILRSHTESSFGCRPVWCCYRGISAAQMMIPSHESNMRWRDMFSPTKQNRNEQIKHLHGLIRHY